MGEKFIYERPFPPMDWLKLIDKSISRNLIDLISFLMSTHANKNFRFYYDGFLLR